MKSNFLMTVLAVSFAISRCFGQVVNIDAHGMPNMPDMVPSNVNVASAQLPTPASTAVPVLTRSYDNIRNGANTNERILTPQSVQRGMRKLFSLQMLGDARGLEAQPLIVPNVTIADGTTHDLAVLATMSNTIWAYDANDGTLLWVSRLGRPIPGSRNIDGWLINDHWGILGTPVIDAQTNTLYCVSWTSPDGTVAKAIHTFHAVNLVDGTQVQKPMSLEGATYDPGHGLPIQKFASAARKQRAALTLTNVGGKKTVFIPFGTIQETAGNAHGWIIAVDISSWSIGASWTASSRYSGGGIWMAGQGLSADEEGYLYAVTGNGSFDGVTEWGECFLKFRYTPGKLEVIDWFSPFSDAGRVGDNPTNVFASRALNGWEDADLGSGGPAIIPSLNLVLGAGKDGVLYVMDRHKMGQNKPAEFLNGAHYAKLKSPPVWFTFFPGFGVDASPNNFQDFNRLYNGRTHHMHSTPVYWNGKLYCWGENGNLRVWSLNAAGIATYLANGAEVASPQSPTPPGGMPGGMISLSANGNNNGILWATVPFADANKQVTQGVLYAYDAANFGRYNDGTGSVRLLWTSPVFTYNKFDVPVVSGGKVYVPTYDGRVDVYGLN